MNKSKHTIVLIVLLLTGLFANYVSANDKKAKELSQKYIIIDGHIDAPYRLREHWEDLSVKTKKGDFDFVRAQQGGLNIPFMSIYVPARYEAQGGAKAVADSLIDSVEAMVYRSPEKFVIVDSVAAMKAAVKDGKLGLAMGIENGSAIEGKLENVDHFYKRGIRYITLTHALANHISDSSYDENYLWQGLSPFGFELVEKMNNTGVMIDISHVSDDAFYDVIKKTKTPVIASHSSLRHFVPGFERNMDDNMVKALGKNGGVLMLNFGSGFISKAANENYNKRSAAVKGFIKQHSLDKNSPKTEKFTEEYKKKFPYPYANIKQVVDHIDHIKKLAGINAIGIGSDYDGVGDSLPIGLKDVSTYPNLIAELLKRGYKEKDIEKILGGNLLRVLTEVEKYAATH